MSTNINGIPFAFTQQTTNFNRNNIVRYQVFLSVCQHTPAVFQQNLPFVIILWAEPRSWMNARELSDSLDDNIRLQISFLEKSIPSTFSITWIFIDFLLLLVIFVALIKHNIYVSLFPSIIFYNCITFRVQFDVCECTIWFNKFFSYIS